MNGGNSSNSQSPTFGDNTISKETERSLIGSLVDSYGFKEDGLVKKTISVTVQGHTHHLVSYYTVADVMANKFITPSKDPRFGHITPRTELLNRQNFRTPVDEIDSVDGRPNDRTHPVVYAHDYSQYAPHRSSYDMANQHMMHRGVPQGLQSYAPPQPYLHSYAMQQPSPTASHHGYPSANINGYNAHAQYGQPALYARPDPSDGYHLSEQSYSSDQRSPTAWPRRGSSFGHSNSIDSATSGLSSASSVDAKSISADSGYSPQYFNPNNSHRKMSLPTPASGGYDRPPLQTYSSQIHSVQPHSASTVESPSRNQQMWAPAHSGYAATQPQHQQAWPNQASAHLV